MRKIAQQIIISMLACFITGNMALADSVMLDNGKIVDGKINHILSNCVEIKTDDGIKTIVRNITASNIKVVDNVRAGIFKQKTYYGEIYYKDDKTLEIFTAEGTLKLKKYKVRNINLAVQKDKL